jgi:LAS superfamily LD-carboxypeptidase LdcB
VDEAIARHGSAEAAHRWVLPPERSAHVAGLAIDVGPAAGARWLEERGSAYGLCRVYLNEPWHFEPLVAPGTPCPELQPDAGAALA